MKKIFLILFAIICLSGCDVTYTINIDDDFNEIITVHSNDAGEQQKIVNYDYNNTAFYDRKSFNEDGLKVPGVEYYDYKFSSSSLTATYKFGNNYNKSNAVHYCFPSLTIDEDEYVKLRTTVDFKCFKLEPELDKVTISIITKNEVIFSNADKVDDNTYTWVLDRNGGFKSIDIKYKNPNYKKTDKKTNPSVKPNKKSENNKSTNKDSKNTKIPVILYVLLSLFFVGLFAIIIISKKKNK